MGKHYLIEFKHHITKLILEKHWGVREVAQRFHIASHSSVVVWLQRVDKYGINGLSRQSNKPRKNKMPTAKKTPPCDNPQDIKALLKELEYLSAENAILKKFKALDEQKKSDTKTDLPIIHTDQGCLYGLARWRKMLIREDGSPYAIQSMSRRGNCYDNAVIESFFSTLKSECFYSRQFNNMDELERAIHDYIRYYNEERIKPKLKNLSPVQYRAQYLT